MQLLALAELIKKADEKHHIDTSSILVLKDAAFRKTFFARTKENDKILFVNSVSISPVEDVTTFVLFEENEEIDLRDWILGQ